MLLNLQHICQSAVCVGEFSHMGFFHEFFQITTSLVVIEVKHVPVSKGELNRCKLKISRQDRTLFNIMSNKKIKNLKNAMNALM